MANDSNQQVPDPNGPPEWADSIGKTLKFLGEGSVAVVLGGAAVLLVVTTMVPTRTLGALRSQRIKWEQRRKEISDVKEQIVMAKTDVCNATEPEEKGHD